MTMLIVQCDTCGNDIRKHHSKVGKNNFCCREHYNEFHKAKTYKCEICQRDFKGQPDNANRFCSRECYNKSHNIKNKSRICPSCDNSFLAKSSDDKYCSWECYNKDRHMPKGEEHWNWQGGKSDGSRDSSKSKKWRLEVYKKDDYTCQKCGSKENLNAHHIYAWAHHEELRYDIANGMALCENCHKNIHKLYGYDSKEQML